MKLCTCIKYIHYKYMLYLIHKKKQFCRENIFIDFFQFIKHDVRMKKETNLNVFVITMN
jgi:hypothetical protein